MSHNLNTIVVAPSGWRAICTCGWWVKGYDRPEVTSAFLEHAEGDHGVIVREDGDDAA